MFVDLETLRAHVGGTAEFFETPDGFTSCGVKVADLIPGGLFVAFDDEENDGLEHISEALAAGATAIATTLERNELPEPAQSVGYIRLVEPTLFAARAAELFAGFPAEKLALYAVTGTNGKTTTATLLHHILRRFYGRAGLISTVGCDCGGELINTGYTTPPPFVTQALFNKMVHNGLKAAVLENSSHGLDQFRTSGAKFAAAIFTNLTGDHLDYHKTMENYFCAKRRLFTELIAPGGVAVINTDDPWGERLCREVQALGVRTAGFGQREGARFRLKNLVTSADGSGATLVTPDGEEIALATPLCGEYNVYNVCGAALATMLTGIPSATVLAALSENVQPPGRLERFSAGGVTCFVDYAHTDDALRRVLSAVKPWCAGRLIALFGAGGDRDRTKRPRMGWAAAEVADVVVVTSDNPRTEAPAKIIADVVAGVPPGAECRTEIDRRKAIALAVNKIAKPGDVVVVAGKGHEEYQEINGVRSHFDDREEVEKCLQKL